MLANPARDADRIVGCLAHQIEAVGIHEVSSVRDFATESDGVARPRCAEATVAFRELGRNAQEAHSIGRFGELADDAARRLERLMHVP